MFVELELFDVPFVRQLFSAPARGAGGGGGGGGGAGAETTGAT